VIVEDAQANAAADQGSGPESFTVRKLDAIEIIGREEALPSA